MWDQIMSTNTNFSLFERLQRKDHQQAMLGALSSS
jgi:hypothetical protein